MAEQEMSPLQKRWVDLANQRLKGRTVKSVWYINDENWRAAAPALWFTDGTVMVLQCDDEGNGPGAGFVISPEPEKDDFILPVCPLRGPTIKEQEQNGNSDG